MSGGSPDLGVLGVWDVRTWMMVSWSPRLVPGVSGQWWNVGFHMLSAGYLVAKACVSPALLLRSSPYRAGEDVRTPGITDPTVTHPLTPTPTNSA